MLRTLKEHFQDFAADVLIKRVLPSLIAAWTADLTRLLHDKTGRQILSEKSEEALVGLAILLVHYGIHLWNDLKDRAAEAKKP